MHVYMYVQHRYDTCHNVIFVLLQLTQQADQLAAMLRQTRETSTDSRLSRVWTYGRWYLRRISSPVLQPHLSLQDRWQTEEGGRTVLAAESTLNRETSSVLSPYLNNTSVLCPRCPYSLRTLSVVSTRSPCCLRGWTSILSNVIRTLSATSVLSPYCIRRYPLLSAGNLGQFVHPLLHPYWLRTLSVLSPPVSANLNKIPYCLRTLYAKFRPYFIRSDPQHQCVGVKGANSRHTRQCPCRIYSSCMH